MDILEKFLSGDAYLVWEACSELKELRCEEELLRLAAHTNKIEKTTKNIFDGDGPGLLSNYYHLKFALRKLKFVRDDIGCLCELYPHNMFFNPNKEAEKGFVVIKEKTTDAKNWTADYRCQCIACGNEFKIEQGEYPVSYTHLRAHET